MEHVLRQILLVETSVGNIMSHVRCYVVLSSQLQFIKIQLQGKRPKPNIEHLIDLSLKNGIRVQRGDYL